MWFIWWWKLCGDHAAEELNTPRPPHSYTLLTPTHLPLCQSFLKQVTDQELERLASLTAIDFASWSHSKQAPLGCSGHYSKSHSSSVLCPFTSSEWGHVKVQKQWMGLFPSLWKFLSCTFATRAMRFWHDAAHHSDSCSINKSNDKTAAIKHDRNAGEPDRERCIEGKVKGSCAQRRDTITFVEAKPSGNGATA